MHLILLIKLKFVQITPQFAPLCLTRLAKGNFIPKTWFSLQGAKIKVCVGVTDLSVSIRVCASKIFKGVHAEFVKTWQNIFQEVPEEEQSSLRAAGMTVIYHYKL